MTKSAASKRSDCSSELVFIFRSAGFNCHVAPKKQLLISLQKFLYSTYSGSAGTFHLFLILYGFHTVPTAVLTIVSKPCWKNIRKCVSPPLTSPAGFTISHFISLCLYATLFSPRCMTGKVTKRRSHWNFWNMAWFFIRLPLFTVSTCAHFSRIYSYVTQGDGARTSSETFLGNMLYFCAFVCVCNPEELRATDGEKVFALQFTAIICPPLSCFFLYLSSPHSSFPIPTISLSASVPLFVQKKTILGCVCMGVCLWLIVSFFQWCSAEVDSCTSHLGSYLTHQHYKCSLTVCSECGGTAACLYPASLLQICRKFFENWNKCL